MGTIHGEIAEGRERERMQRQMREFGLRVQRNLPRQVRGVAYKVYFWRPYVGAKVDSLIELTAGNQDTWCARANAPDAWRAFSKALGSLKQIVIEMDFRGDEQNAGQTKNSA